MTKTPIWVVIPAAGVGKRMGADCPKQYLPFVERTIMEATLMRLHQALPEAVLSLSISSQDSHWPAVKARLPESLNNKIRQAPGGEERRDSVLNALKSLEGQASDSDWVLVHDAARPCVRSSDIAALIDAVEAKGHGGLLASPVKDTMKRSDQNGNVQETVEREHLWHALTPQVFHYGTLYAALKDGIANGLPITDEAMAVESAGGHVALVEGRADNIKITRPEDLALAELYWQAQERETKV
ncbi:2-C-methyl-D-erythritol 4-phosphate cytidylyltransferase [gamma proteobacterium HTCC5015]|nr:2-C-methyl-D-erythritol 4-phosphate cytidylyltransferase [gamma proteobacterium HTCC5015]